MDNIVLLMLLVLALMAFLVLLSSFFTINTAERGVVERFNKFSRIAGPGLSLKIPLVETVNKVDMRVQELPFKIETKTKDNVFVVIPVSVQYQVLADKDHEIGLLSRAADVGKNFAQVARIHDVT